MKTYEPKILSLKLSTLAEVLCNGEILLTRKISEIIEHTE